MARYMRVFPTRRRALALLLFALVYIVYGCGLYWSPPPEQVGPRWWPGVLFVTAGSITLYSALRDRPRNEWVGFTTLYVTSIIWALNFIVLVVIDAGARPWSGLLIWSFVTLLLLLLAGWAEPPTREVLREAIQVMEKRAEDRAEAEVDEQRRERDGDLG